MIERLQNAWRRSRSTALAIAMALVCFSPATHAVELDVSVGGGPILSWDDPGNIGNGFGLHVQLHVHELIAVGLGAATVLPDSRIQAQFGAFWVEGRVHPFGRDTLWTPYALVGLGFASGDDVAADVLTADTTRWNAETASFLGLLGVGIRFGQREGLFATLDVRAFNASQAGAHLTAGYAF